MLCILLVLFLAVKLDLSPSPLVDFPKNRDECLTGSMPPAFLFIS